MKHLATLFTLGFVSFFLTFSDALAGNSFNIREIRNYAPNADLSSLSNLHIQMLLVIIHGGEKEGEKFQGVRSYLLHTG